MRSLYLVNPLHYALHHDRTWRLTSDFAFARQPPYLVELAIWEVVDCAMALPVILQKAQGEWRAMALLHGWPGRDSAIAEDGSWRANAPVPAQLRYHPFRKARAENFSKDALLLSVAEDEACVMRSQAGEPFFDGQARPTERVRAVLRRLMYHEAGVTKARAVAERLAHADLLAPIAPPAGRRPLELATLDRQRVDALEPALWRDALHADRDMIRLCAALLMGREALDRAALPEPVTESAASARQDDASWARETQAEPVADFLLDDDAFRFT